MMWKTLCPFFLPSLPSPPPSFLIHRPFGPKFHRMIKMIIGPSADHHPDPACAALIAASIEEHTDQQDLALSVLWWTNTVSLPAIASLGLLCNALNLLVLSSSEARRMPSWHLLVALALFDSLFLLFAVLELTPVSLVVHPDLLAVHTRAVLFVRMMGSSFYKASILIVVCFNVERFLCVCRPLWAHRAGLVIGSRRFPRMFGVVLGAFALGLLCSVQWPLAWTVVECPGHSPSAVVAMRNSETLQTYYRLMDWLCLCLFNLAPILLLALLNFQLLFTLRRIVRRDSSASATLSSTMTTNGAEQAMVGTNPPEHIHRLEGQPIRQQTRGLNANAMLFAVVLLLFVCIGPQAPARLLYEWYGHYHTGAILYTCISQQLVFLNASLNFCLYCLVSRRYRSLLGDTLRRLGNFCRWCQRFDDARSRKSRNRRRQNNGDQGGQQQQRSSSSGISNSSSRDREAPLVVPLVLISGRQ